MKKIISVILNLFLIASLFLPGFARAEWVDFDGSSAASEIAGAVEDRYISSGDNPWISSVTSDVEERYGFDQDIYTRAKRKMSAPRVDIFFDNTNPKTGEKVTAHAIPEFFKNDPPNLYYTWYLIHTRDGSVKTATNSVNAGIREASKIMARGDYDPDLDGQEYEDSDEDPDKDGWPAVDQNSFDEDTIAAPMGGADGVGGLPEETVDEYSSAEEYCDSLGDKILDECSFYDGSGYRPLETYYTPQSEQSNYYCNLCKSYFSGDGSSAYEEAKTARNDCCYENTPEASLQCSYEDPDTGDTVYYKCDQADDTDYCGVSSNALFDSCYDAFRTTLRSAMSTCLDSQYSSCEANWENVHSDSNGDDFSDLTEEAVTGVSRCYKHNFGIGHGAEIFRENELSDSTTGDSSGLDFPVSCKHKWLNAPDFKSGSGEFLTGEEEYWKTDPTDPDTDGDGFSDEADVIGLGQENFTWNYQPGDRVGVVAEGTSLTPTDEKNAYYKIMWGYLGVCDATKTGLMENDKCDDSDDYGFGFFDTKAPAEETGKKLEVSLSFTPDTPIADPSPENSGNIQDDGTITDADEITVASSLDSTDFNPQNLYYTWQISKAQDLAGDDWEEVKDLKENFNLDSASSGLGITSFTFSPKKKVLEGGSDIAYFKATLSVSTASSVKNDRGRSSVIIPINKNGLKIALYKVDIQDGKAVLGEEVCNEGLYQMLCPAVQNQMLAAKITSQKYKASDFDFAWKLNEEVHEPPQNSGDLFEGWDEATVFFPITSEEEETESISVTATPKDKLQPVSGDRMITAVEPTLFVYPADTSISWPKVMTVEKEDAKYAFEDIESEDDFEAKPESEVSYFLDFVPYYLIGEDYLNTAIDWEVNGESVFTGDYAENPWLSETRLEDNDRTIKFPVAGEEGQSYTLGAKVKKYWREEEKNILFSAWNIEPETLVGETSVTVTTKIPPEPATEETGLAVPKQILAAIGTNMPHYLMYLLRLVLTMLVMFFVSSVFYGISQKAVLYEEK